MTSTRSTLRLAILAQEQRVREVDGHLRESLMRVRSRLRRGGGRGPSRLWGMGALVGGWLLLRHRHVAAVNPPARRRDRVAVLLELALPTLVPLVGVRVAGALSALAAVTEQSAQPPPDVVPLVDLDLYAGKWYEVARLPERHERARKEEVSATYERRGRGLHVIDRRRRADGRLVVVHGTARVADARSRAKLEVTSAPLFLRWLPWVWADYWILDLSPDYTRALVGTPDRRSLRMLAREPSIGASEFRALRLIAAAQGYDTQRVSLATPRSVRPDA